MSARRSRNGKDAGRLACRLAGALSALAIAQMSGGVIPARAAPPADAGIIAERPPLVELERQPHNAVRMLAIVQERVAQGDESALALQKAVVADIAQELKTFPADVWKSVRNRQALIKFALSGGDPTLLQTMLARKLFTEWETPLARAALAYAEGQRSAVLRLLDKVDIYELPPSLAGHVALVNAIVIANTDLARVIRLCDDARLLSPGTLIEETALRLAIEATITQGDQAKFEAITLRYFRRFPRSPYLNAVIRPVAGAIAEGGYSERPEGARWVQRVAQFLDPNRLVQFYTALAEAGLRASKLATTVHAARLAQKYARKGSVEEAWALAYEGGALVIGSDSKEGLARLAAAEAIGIGGRVDEMIASARSVAKMIMLPPPALPAPPVAPDPTKTPQPPVTFPGLPDGEVAPATVSAPMSSPPASSPQPMSPGGTPAAANALSLIAQVDKLLKELDE